MMNSAEFYARIADVLREDFGVDLNREADQRALASDILKMSDFYANEPEGMTPWFEPWCQRAQLAYFLPLNVLRLRRVIREGLRVGFFNGIRSSVDFGAGLGALDFAGQLENPLQNPSWRRPHEIEISPVAQKIRARLAPAYETSIEGPEREMDLFMSSYALTELIELDAAEFLERSPNLLIIEPSTRDDGRRLSEFRDRLIEAGAHAWAPCTHQGRCPLILNSATDWCHDRVLIEGPEDVPWREALERYMPIKNRTLTMSYLYISLRKPPELTGYARLTGDALVEKGKTRQLFCRGEAREFLAWMHRHGEPELHPRGELVRIPPGEQKSNELRIQGNLQIFQKG
ncbi:MAG: hypothetical protein KF767_12515 [Bdellovibrionaceae bacterium]|nr:hypothetical protein [Pseudobdellovibrionaceae bacterium]